MDSIIWGIGCRSETANLKKLKVGKIEFDSAVDYNLYNIMLEEADYLFHEDRQVEDVAEIIQNRANLYIVRKNKNGSNIHYRILR